MIELQDTLLQLSIMIDRAKIIESTVYEDYLTSDTCDARFIEFGYERLKTFHEILGGYLLEAQKLVAKASKLAEH